MSFSVRLIDGGAVLQSMDVPTADDSDCVAILRVHADVLRGPRALPAFLKLLVQHTVLLQVSCELQGTVGDHPSESTLEVFGPRCWIDLV